MDVLLLDDGFQHRQLARDVDILTISTTHPFGSPEKLLPAGTLREPPSALRRADLILLTHADTPDISAHIKKNIKSLAPNALVLESIHQPVHLYRLVTSYQLPVTSYQGMFPKREPLLTGHWTLDTGHYNIKELKGKRVLAVCGIGNPEAFVATLMRCSVASVELLAFPDHHVYTKNDKQQIDATFQKAGADLIVTTQKDEHKLARFVDAWELSVVVLAVALVITEGDEELNNVLKEKL